MMSGDDQTILAGRLIHKVERQHSSKGYLCVKSAGKTSCNKLLCPNRSELRQGGRNSKRRKLPKPSRPDPI